MLIEERARYAVQLASLIEEGSDIIYVDETTFNTHLRAKRTYMYPECPVNIEISNRRLSGVTLFGAIGSCLQKPVFMTGRSTNSLEFREFLLKIIEQLPAGMPKSYLVHDGARAHYSNISRDLIDTHFHRLALPPYSC